VGLEGEGVLELVAVEHAHLDEDHAQPLAVAEDGLSGPVQVRAARRPRRASTSPRRSFGHLARRVHDAAFDEMDGTAGGTLGEAEHAGLAPDVQLTQDAWKNAFAEGSLHPNSRAEYSPEGVLALAKPPS
jgi:hypothetical protein